MAMVWSVLLLFLYGYFGAPEHVPHAQHNLLTPLDTPPQFVRTRRAPTRIQNLTSVCSDAGLSFYQYLRVQYAPPLIRQQTMHLTAVGDTLLITSHTHVTLLSLLPLVEGGGISHTPSQPLDITSRLVHVNVLCNEDICSDLSKLMVAQPFTPDQANETFHNMSKADAEQTEFQPNSNNPDNLTGAFEFVRAPLLFDLPNSTFTALHLISSQHIPAKNTVLLVAQLTGESIHISELDVDKLLNDPLHKHQARGGMIVTQPAVLVQDYVFQLVTHPNTIGFRIHHYFTSVQLQSEHGVIELTVDVDSGLHYWLGQPGRTRVPHFGGQHLGRSYDNQTDTEYNQFLMYLSALDNTLVQSCLLNVNISLSHVDKPGETHNFPRLQHSEFWCRGDPYVRRIGGVLIHRSIIVEHDRVWLTEVHSPKDAFEDDTFWTTQFLGTPQSLNFTNCEHTIASQQMPWLKKAVPAAIWNTAATHSVYIPPLGTYVSSNMYWADFQGIRIDPSSVEGGDIVYITLSRPTAWMSSCIPDKVEVECCDVTFNPNDFKFPPTQGDDHGLPSVFLLKKQHASAEYEVVDHIPCTTIGTRIAHLVSPTTLTECTVEINVVPPTVELDGCNQELMLTDLVAQTIPQPHAVVQLGPNLQYQLLLQRLKYHFTEKNKKFGSIEVEVVRNHPLTADSQGSTTYYFYLIGRDSANRTKRCPFTVRTVAADSTTPSPLRSVSANTGSTKWTVMILVGVAVAVGSVMTLAVWWVVQRCHTKKKQNPRTRLKFKSEDSTLADLNITMSGKIIGCGSQATVYEGLDEITGELYALKQYHQNHEMREEYLLFRGHRHSNIVKVYGYCEDTSTLIMQYLGGGTLLDLVQNATPTRLSWPTIGRYSSNILNGLRYLHGERSVVHRDIKPSNIMLDSRGVCHIADLGTAKNPKTQATTRTFVGSFRYIPPEWVNGGKHTSAGDMWMFGLCVLFMATGAQPWGNITEDDLSCILTELGKLNEADAAVYPLMTATDGPFVPQVMRDLLIGCLQVNPKNRPTAAALFNKLQGAKIV